MKEHEKPIFKKSEEDEKQYSVSGIEKKKCPKKCNMYCTDWNCSGMCEYYIEKKGWSFLGAECGLQFSEHKAS